MYAEKTGRYFDCYIRQCNKNPVDNSYDMQPIADFIADLKDIQKEMQADDRIEPRRLQLMLNFNGAHWTAIDFEVSKDNIKCCMMDAIQYYTLNTEVPEMAKHLKPSNMYLAYGPDEAERLQLYYSCFINSYRHLKLASEHKDFYRHMEGRASHDTHFASYYEKKAPGVNIVRWTSMPADFNWDSERVDQSLKLWSVRNTHHKRRGEYLSRIDPSHKETTLKINSKGEYTNKSNENDLKKIGNQLDQYVNHVKQIDDVNSMMRRPLKNAEYQAKCSEANKIYEEKVRQAKSVLKAKRIKKSTKNQARELMSAVEKNERMRLTRSDSWGMDRYNMMLRNMLTILERK